MTSVEELAELEWLEVVLAFSFPFAEDDFLVFKEGTEIPSSLRCGHLVAGCSKGFSKEVVVVKVEVKVRAEGWADWLSESTSIS